MLANIAQLNTWTDYRRKRFWALALVVLYTLTGFVVAPWALARLGPGLALDFTQRELSMGEISFNPFTLRLEVLDLALVDSDPVNARQPNLLALDSVVINVAFTQLLQLTLGFDEISLNRPQIYLARYAFADSNWGRMLNDIDAAAPPQPEPAASTAEDEELRLFIARLAINEGSLALEDGLTEDTFNTTIEPINITVNNLSTLKDVSGQQSIKLANENGVELTWEGSLELNPLVSSGTVELSGSPLPTVYRYLEKQLGFTLDNCCLEIDLAYALASAPSGDVDVQISDANVLLSNLELNAKDTDEAIFRLPALRITGGELAWPEQTARIREISLENPELHIWLNEDGSANLEQLLLTAAAPSDESDLAPQGEQPVPADPITDSDAEAPWSFGVDAVRIKGMQLALSDRSLRNPGELQLQPIDLSVMKISSAPNSRWPVLMDATVTSGGAIAFDGGLIADPDVLADGRLSISELGLAVLQPWIADAAQVALQAGALNVALDIQSGPTESLKAAGEVSINGLDITDTIKNESLVGWQQLALQDIDFLLDANTLQINRVKLSKPFAQLNIAADGTTNFDSLSTTEEAPDAMNAEASSAEPVSAPFKVKVGSTVIDNGAIDYTDQSLPLPFRVMIEEFGGTMSTIDSTSRQPSTLDFKGKVGEFGLTTLKGEVSVLAPDEQTDVQLDFQNLSMPTLSPYTAEFVGRAIDSGKLDLALDYRLENRRIDGANNMVLRDFSLGDKVASDDAMNLPLDLAIALLTDSKGVIDLDLEVQGDMDDPGFSASGIVLKAFANIITKAATAPFKLLGNLIPGGTDLDLEAIEFDPGLTELSPPEREKLLTLTTALQERPGLQLQVDGGYAPEVDRAALQAINLNNQLSSLLGRPDPSPEQTRKALEKLAKQQLTGLSLSTLRKDFELPDPDTGKLRFDELAYSTSLRKRLEANQPVDDEYLVTLGRQRRDMMVAFLTSQPSSTESAAEFVTGGVDVVAQGERGRVRVPLQVVPVPSN